MENETDVPETLYERRRLASLHMVLDLVKDGKVQAESYAITDMAGRFEKYLEIGKS